MSISIDRLTIANLLQTLDGQQVFVEQGPFSINGKLSYQPESSQFKSTVSVHELHGGSARIQFKADDVEFIAISDGGYRFEIKLKEDDE